MYNLKSYTMSQPIQNLEEELKYSSEIQTIKKMLSTIIVLLTTQYYQVRGDGNCLIRTLLKHLLEQRGSDIAFSILVQYISSVDILIEVVAIYNYDKELFDLGNNSHEALDDPVKSVKEKIDTIVNEIRNYLLHVSVNIENNLQPVSYYIDDSAIDYNALRALLTMFRFESLIVFSLVPNRDLNDRYIMKFDAFDDNILFHNDKKITYECSTVPRAFALCRYGRNHYSVLLNDNGDKIKKFMDKYEFIVDTGDTDEINNIMEFVD